MSHHEQLPILPSEVLPTFDMHVEQGPAMSPILLHTDSVEHDDEAQKKMLEVIKLFAEPPISEADVPVKEGEPHFRVLTRTLLNGTRGEFRWGATSEQETQVEVEIKGSNGLTMLCIALSHQKQEGRYVVTYGSTVPGAGKTGKPDHNVRLIDAFLLAANGLLVRKDPPDIAVGGLKKRNKGRLPRK